MHHGSEAKKSPTAPQLIRRDFFKFIYLVATLSQSYISSLCPIIPAQCNQKVFTALLFFHISYLTSSFQDGLIHFFSLQNSTHDFFVSFGLCSVLFFYFCNLL